MPATGPAKPAPAKTRARKPAIDSEAGSRDTPRRASSPGAAEVLDTRGLESLVGYNARRASLAIAAGFYRGMAPFELTQAEYSVLALLAANDGATSRQLCGALDILPPNFTGLLAKLERRGLVERRPHPRDGRAIGLHLTPAGAQLAADATAAVEALERIYAAALTAGERATLTRLLKKLYA